jgi:hypothetical protein
LKTASPVETLLEIQVAMGMIASRYPRRDGRFAYRRPVNYDLGLQRILVRILRPESDPERALRVDRDNLLPCQAF